MGVSWDMATIVLCVAIVHRPRYRTVEHSRTIAKTRIKQECRIPIYDDRSAQDDSSGPLARSQWFRIVRISSYCTRVLYNFIGWLHSTQP
jgi:hypothetical protein